MVSTPVTDQPSAKDFLFGFCTDRYALACSALGIDGTMRYGKVVYKDVPPADQHWARTSTQVVSEDQETLRNGNGVRRFCTVGIVTVQLFGPVADTRAPGYLDIIAEAFKSAFRGFQGDNLEFTNPAIHDNVPAEPNWVRINVVCNFQYRQFIS